MIIQCNKNEVRTFNNIVFVPLQQKSLSNRSYTPKKHNSSSVTTRNYPADQHGSAKLDNAFLQKMIPILFAII